jgi:DNA-binding GntR family transcriptional regulator/anti-sigma regulatory factor (Ser/Thr protein kinase)
MDEMLRGRWQAGDIVSAYGLAEELSISRTPVVEALKRLESEGLVEIIPQVGCRIVRPTPQALNELFSVRAALEGLAAAAAAREIDDDGLAQLELTLRRLEEAAERGDRGAYAQLNQSFHLLIADASGMPRLAETARSSVWVPLSYQLARLEVTDAQLRESGAEHRELYEALRRRTARRARAAAERHARLAAARFAGDGELPRHGELTHRALVYDQESEFLASTVPFVQDGLAADERVLVVTTSHNAEVLGNALGGQADEVEFRDSAEWYQLPSHTLLSYERYVEEADRKRVRVVGEVAWTGETSAPMSEWIRYESILNAAFALQPISIVCPYDARKLPDHILAGAGRTHPELCSGTDVVHSPDYVEVNSLIRELDREGLEEPAGPTVDCPITPDLRDVREFILQRAHTAGLSGKSIQDTFLAVQEVAANVIVHGAGQGTMRSWLQDGELLYEIRDEGAGVGDPLIGQFASDPALMTEPRGLWLARLLCDLVEVRTHDRGLVVRLHISLD